MTGPLTMDSPTAAQVKVMLARCGLSQTDAADFVEKDARMVRRWISGELPMPVALWQLLVDLCARQDRAAEVEIEKLKVSSKKSGDRPIQSLIMLVRTQDEARWRGWPCVGAYVAVVRRIVEWAPKHITILPHYPTKRTVANMAD